MVQVDRLTADLNTYKLKLLQADIRIINEESKRAAIFTSKRIRTNAHQI
jgi:hypothetical protein